MLINSFSQAEAFLKTRRQYGIKPGLERIEKMLPTKNRSLFIVHIAGTNGKGTVQAYIERGLLELNKSLKVAKFTSPSLEGYLGYYYLNTRRIEESEFIYALNQLLPVIESLDSQGNHPTEFEIITALCLPLFNEKADVLLLEVGMGGRFDTTNALQTDLPIITSISHDHTDYLGQTLSEITWHKAGIIQAAPLVICGAVDPVSRKVIESQSSINTNPYFVDAINEEVSSPVESNLKVALAAIEYMASKLKIPFDQSIEKQILKKLSHLQIPGRKELIYRQPNIIIDGAHNMASMKALVTYYGENTKDINLIISAFKDKDLDGMLEVATPEFKSVHLTSFKHERARDKANLSQFNYPLHTNWQELIDKIMISNNNQAIYLFTGSVYFTSLVKEYIKLKYQ